jgi:hypothetical protein
MGHDAESDHQINKHIETTEQDDFIKSDHQVNKIAEQADFTESDHQVNKITEQTDLAGSDQQVKKLTDAVEKIARTLQKLLDAMVNVQFSVRPKPANHGDADDVSSREGGYRRYSDREGSREGSREGGWGSGPPRRPSGGRPAGRFGDRRRSGGGGDSGVGWQKRPMRGRPDGERKFDR